MVFKDIPIGKIKNKFNVRKEEDNEIKELAASINAEGLLQPLVVHPVGNHYELIAGHRRFLAIKSLGWLHVECNVLEDTVSDRDVLIMQIAENLQRKQMSAYEYKEIFDLLRDTYGYNSKTIATVFHKSQPWVSWVEGCVKKLKDSYDGNVPEEKKKMTAGEIEQAFKRKTRTPRKHFNCKGFTVESNGHSYLFYFTDFEREKEINDFIEKHKVTEGL
ncbi:MAG: ParB/RepB/Spo0J family partition protein [Bacilli bacterium]|nr:ParB/RepB/Spo0J family partition protein [Bacilli bacterium]